VERTVQEMATRLFDDPESGRLFSRPERAFLSRMLNLSPDVEPSSRDWRRLLNLRARWAQLDLPLGGPV